MKNLFVTGLTTRILYEEVSSAIVKSGLIGKEAILLLEKEMNVRLSALQVQFCCDCGTSCVSCTFVTPSSRFILSLTFHDNIFDFILEIIHILVAYSIGAGITVKF